MGGFSGRGIGVSGRVVLKGLLEGLRVGDRGRGVPDINVGNMGQGGLLQISRGQGRYSL